MNYVTVGVYANGDYTINIVKPEHLDSHLDYNVKNRFGRALFVNGVCHYPGYLNEQKVSEWEDKLRTMEINSKVPSETYD